VDDGANELVTACHDADGARPNFALGERVERGGPGPSIGDDDEGRTVNFMKSILRHQGVGGTRRRYGVETSECAGGRREYGGEQTEEGGGSEWK
jgi:hypothetical protein